MASGYVTCAGKEGKVFDKERSPEMASMKKATSKSAGKQKIQAGPSGKMVGFKGVGTQKPGITSVSGSGGGSYAKGGPSGKMAGFSGVKNATKA